MNYSSRFYAVFALLLAACLPACQSVPDSAFRVSESAVKVRALQTRQYDNLSELQLLQASVSVLQDLGFSIDEIETSLGVVTGSKGRDGTELGQVAVSMLLELVWFDDIPVDKQQQFRVLLAVKPIRENDKNDLHQVRVTFQRTVWNDEGKVARRETLEKPQMYQQFFSMLSKAIALQENSI